jgi:hypothetical protein
MRLARRLAALESARPPGTCFTCGRPTGKGEPEVVDFVDDGLFGCLVDAIWRAAAEHMNRAQACGRPADPTLDTLAMAAIEHRAVLNRRPVNQPIPDSPTE